MKNFTAFLVLVCSFNGLLAQDYLTANKGLNIGPTPSLSSPYGLHLETSTNTTGGLPTSSTYTYFQVALRDWSGSHALLFNAYASGSMINGSLGTPGNTKYANNQGAYSNGAGAIMFFANGGVMDFMISPAAGSSGKDTDITWGTPKMRINRNGDVGIGTTNTTGYKLSVAGKIRAEEIKVESGWADYVFDESYELRPLKEVESYIKENKHLPGIPSEAEVRENGIALGEMNAKLLEKIEELTLYMIELKKENERLIDRVTQLENK